MGMSSAYWTCFSQNSFTENCFSWADACFYHTIHQEVNDLEIPPPVPAKWITRKHNYLTAKSSLAFITLIVGRNHGLMYCFSLCIASAPIHSPTKLLSQLLSFRACNRNGRPEGSGNKMTHGLWTQSSRI